MTITLDKELIRIYRNIRSNGKFTAQRAFRLAKDMVEFNASYFQTYKK